MDTPTRTSAHRTRSQVRRFERILDRYTGFLTERFGAQDAAEMRQEMLDEYRPLVPQVPYVGGRRNRYTPSLVMSAWALAVYRVLLRHGGSVQDAGEVLHRYARGTMERVPRALRTRMFAPRKARAEKHYRWTQAHPYPAGWVFELVDTTGEPFDFGMDITECGIVKFLHAQGADELTPYLCDLDYVMAESSGAGLTRTKTLAWGCDRCDFRFAIPGSTTATWPPEFAERRCGETSPT